MIADRTAGARVAETTAARSRRSRPAPADRRADRGSAVTGERASASSAGRPSARARATTSAARCRAGGPAVRWRLDHAPLGLRCCSVHQRRRRGPRLLLLASLGGDLAATTRSAATNGPPHQASATDARPALELTPLDRRTEGSTRRGHGRALGEQLGHLCFGRTASWRVPGSGRRDLGLGRPGPAIDVDPQRLGDPPPTSSLVQGQLDRLEVEASPRKTGAEVPRPARGTRWSPIRRRSPRRQIGRRDVCLADDLLGLAQPGRRPCACAVPGSPPTRGPGTSPQRAMPSFVFTLTMLWVRKGLGRPSLSTRSNRPDPSTAPRARRNPRRDSL
jgi:hypothetical protein